MADQKHLNKKKIAEHLAEHGVSVRVNGQGTGIGPDGGRFAEEDQCLHALQRAANAASSALEIYLDEHDVDPVLVSLFELAVQAQDALLSYKAAQ